MNLNRMLIACWTVLVLLDTLSAEAQFRRLPTPSRSSRSRTGTNSIHERTKNEAQAAYRRGDYQRAINLTSSVLRANSRDDVAYYLRASARVDSGRQQHNIPLLRSGIADAREAIRLKGLENPIYFIPYLYGMTTLSKFEDKTDHAEISEKYAGAAANRAGVRSEDKAHLLFQRGRARVYLKKYEGAISDFQSAIRLIPDQIGFHMDLADAYARAGRADDAVQVYKQAVDRFPREPVVYNNRGMLHERQGEIVRALADFTRALELDPRYHFAYTNRAFALLKSDNAAAAENDLTASLKIEPNQPAAYSLRATALMDQGKIGEAISNHQQVLKLTPKDSNAHADLAYARFYVGDYTAAGRSFDKAVELNNKRQSLNPWRYLSLALAGNEEAARSKFAEVIEPDRAKRDWIDHLLSYLSGQMEDAELIGSVNDEPDIKTAQLCEAHFFIAQRHSMAGEGESAAEHYRKAIETGAKQLAAYRGAGFALKNVSVENTTNTANDK